jgi:hypothetical protein
MLTALRAFRNVRNSVSYSRDEALALAQRQAFAPPTPVPIYAEYAPASLAPEAEARRQVQASGSVHRNLTRYAIKYAGYDVVFEKVETLGIILGILSLLHFNTKHDRLSLVVGAGLLMGVFQMRRHRGV